MMDRLDKGVSEIPADLDLECPPGFVKGLPQGTTVFKETLKTSSQAPGYFQRANGMGGGSSKSLMATDFISKPSTLLHKLLTTTPHAAHQIYPKTVPGSSTGTSYQRP